MLPIAMLAIPLLGALVIAFAPSKRAKWIALIASSLALLVSLVIAFQFAHWSDGGFSDTVGINWLTQFGVTLNMHFDSVSLLLVLLTTMLMPLCVLGSFTSITTRLREYYAWMLVLGPR
jgi:NADH-quinone oxidoreductase subunit M